LQRKTAAELNGELSALRDFFAYNTFVRRRYLAMITGLPEKVRTKDRGASYPTLVDIMAHVLDAYDCWLHVCQTGELCDTWKHTDETGEDDLLDRKGLSVEGLTLLEDEVEGRMDDFMRKLQPEDLNGEFHYTLGSGEKREVRTRKVGDMLWHLVEEELQHRGELNALLWQDDIEPPVTGWFAWKKSLQARA